MIGRRAHGPSPFEATIGFSRAVRVGPITAVSGTGPVEADGSSTPGDAAAQARRCFEIVFDALRQVGASPREIVRTRIYLTDPADADAVGRIHAELFDDLRPAATMVVVAALLRPEWRVEVEADAYSPDLR